MIVGSKIYNIIGFSYGIIAYLGGFIFLFLFFTSGWAVRTILLAIYAYQLLFAKKSDFVIRALTALKPQQYFKSYNVHISEKIPEKNSMMLVHPHGCLATNMIFTKIERPELQSFRMCASRLMLLTPISGLFAKWMGTESVDRGNIKKLISENRNISLVPGGFEEGNLTNCKEDRVFIKQRKGFVKYALQGGYRVYPSYTFGENKMYYTINGFDWLNLFMAKMKMPFAVFIGKRFLYPDDQIEINTVIGNGIPFPKIDNPSVEDVERFHVIYMENLVALYNENKEKFGGSKSLKIY